MTDDQEQRLNEATRPPMGAALALKDSALRAVACAAVGTANSLAGAYVADARREDAAEILLSIFLPLAAHPDPETLLGLTSSSRWRGSALKGVLISLSPRPASTIAVFRRLAADRVTGIAQISRIALEEIDASGCLKEPLAESGIQSMTFSTIYGEAAVHAFSVAQRTFANSDRALTNEAGVGEPAGSLQGLPDGRPRYEAAAKRTGPPLFFLFLVEPMPAIALLATAFLASAPWSVGAAVLAVPFAGLWLGHLNYYYGSKWKRTWHRLDHAWIPLAVGIKLGDLTWDEALKTLIGIHYPGVNRNACFEDMKREWVNTRLHVNWLRECFPNSPVDFTSIEAVRRENGFSHLDLIEAIIHRESSMKDYAAFAIEQARRGLPRRGVGAPREDSR